MTAARRCLLALCYFLCCTALSAQYIAIHPISTNFPFMVGMMMDGGTFYIYEIAKGQQNTKAHPDFLLYYFDGKMGSATRGDFFSGTFYEEEDEKAKKLSWPEAETVFAQFQRALTKWYGKKKLAEMLAYPMPEPDLEHSSVALEEQVKDPKFNDRWATQWVARHIVQYGVGKATEAALPWAAKVGFGKPFCVFPPADYPWAPPVEGKPAWKTDAYAAWAVKIKDSLHEHEADLRKERAWLLAFRKAGPDAEKESVLLLALSAATVPEAKVLWSATLR